ncbi:uncharacterized protein LOC129906287 isoform X3 [Episyrphus balteatus]|uniref:uncharacterized protein LOC129906287 isoform X3 n=1 Tax=Episyrphus balteatus TaxID=286459 RepID=UPI0024858AFC|nr:uncharacterized protein LOC129906287 isoform X3 [Episyrphus balteatus]
MDFFSAYITIFFIVFLLFPTLFMCLKLVALCCYTGNQRRVNNLGPNNVRQAAVYTIATDPRRGNDSTSNFPDFFWDVSPPRSNEPAKDDKDLPSYEEVMRIEMARQVVDSTIQATPITTSTTTNTVQQTLPSSQPVRLPV